MTEIANNLKNKFFICESVAWMRENLPDGCIDLTVTSPPYDGLRTYKGYSFDYKAMLSELYRVTKDGGVVVWVVGDATINGSETGTSFRQALYAMEIGFKLHDTMIYCKKNVPLSHKRYEQEFEYMFVLVKEKLKTFNPIMILKKYMDKRMNKTFNRNKKGVHVMGYSSSNPYRIKGNIWEHAVGGGNSSSDDISYKHPAIFPEKLAEDHIISWSNDGDLILDPMCGSGTTCKMAWINNRDFIGADCSEEYINDVCKPRLERYGWPESRPPKQGDLFEEK